LDTVEELLKNESHLYALNNILSQFIDVEHLLSLCIQLNKQETPKLAENKILHTLYLKHTIELIDPLRELLKSGSSKLMKTYYENLDDSRFEKIKVEIDKLIDEKVKYQKGILNMKIQKCCAIKRNINGLLDLNRKKFAETTDIVSEHVKQLQESTKLPIKLQYNSSKGYYMQLNTKNTLGINLPQECIKITRNKNSIVFTTDQLISLNDRLNELLSDIYLISNGLLNDLFLTIRKHFGCFYKLVECISLFDMLQSFATYSSTGDFVRPLFGECLAVDNAIHPVLLKSIGDSVISNRIYASDESSFTIITGSNMSGKSTYLRQIATLQIIAQCGSFICASYASFRIAHQIFSRLGTDDDIEVNSSSFEKEMIEMNYIIQNCNKNSLILIDELCRSTSHDEGLAITMAFCEYLVTQMDSFVFFATHFTELTLLDSIYSNVINYHLESFIDSDTERIVHTFILNKGSCKITNYGLLSADVTCLHADVLNDAKTIAESLRNEITKLTNSTDLRQSMKRRCVLALNAKLIQCAKHNQLDDNDLEKHLEELKFNFELDYNELLD
jgi:DNA mismatch repair protein MSH4